MQKRAFSLLFIAASLFLTSNYAKAAEVGHVSLGWIKNIGQPARHSVKDSSGVWQDIGPIIQAVNDPVYSASGASGAKAYEFKGKYELDIADVVPRPANVPKTPAKVALDVATSIPRPSAAKAIAKSLPYIGTVIAVVDFANDLAKAWDAADPAGAQEVGTAGYNSIDGVHRSKSQLLWWNSAGRGPFSRASLACFDLNKDSIDYVYNNSNNAWCDLPSGTIGSAYSRLSKATVPIPQTMAEQLAPSISPEKIEQAFEAVKNSPHFSPDLTDSESAANTRVLPSTSATPSTTTSTSGNTTTTTTTSPTQSTTTTKTTNPDNSTKTTTSVTNITYNNNTINTTTNTTTINKDKDGNPLPDTPPDPDTPPNPGTPPPDPDTPPEDPPEEVTPPTDPDMPEVPDFYEQKYPDGFAGVWNTRMTAIKASPLFSLVDTLTPSSLGSGGGCPSFTLPVSIGQWNWGTHNISPPCIVWDFGKLFLMLGALLLARALIFGG